MVKLNNTARPLDKRSGADYFQWRVYVDEPRETLEQIKEVTYRLHPTFPNPIQKRDDPEDGFALDTAGWGEFTIMADVTFKDGHTERVSHWLDLSKRAAV